jgi:hypothetical protein
MIVQPDFSDAFTETIDPPRGAGNSKDAGKASTDLSRSDLIALARPLTYYPDFNKSVALDWLVKGIFAKGHTSHLFGPPGSGKSALLGSVAVYLGSQPDWYGFKIKRQYATVYFPFERLDLVKKRIWAQCQRDGISADCDC